MNIRPTDKDLSSIVQHCGETIRDLLADIKSMSVGQGLTISPEKRHRVEQSKLRLVGQKRRRMERCYADLRKRHPGVELEPRSD